ncbi:subunits of heterodimeric actin filament capping protein Capz [Hymenopellis radicata]|nr:subunits of heterodimeric actin filament capping protein Capz [Hymenopellis radicata]
MPILSAPSPSPVSPNPEYAPTTRMIDDLLGSVDQPVQLKTDRTTGREYLACDYNRDGESQPGEYDPPLDDGTVPSSKLRKLEISANSRLSIRIERCGVSSVYLWDLDGGGFAGVVLFTKVMMPASPNEPSGSWDSIHIFETAERGRNTHFLLIIS